MQKAKDTITGLASKECSSCRLAEHPLDADHCQSLLDQLCDQWFLNENKALQRKYKFKNFAQALEFTNKLGQLAEQQGHHPDIFLGWGKVSVTLMTHKAGGLTEDDFIMAAKIDKLQ